MTDNPDVLVLGGGLAGHAAAISAAEDGATVTILEKTDEIGGSAPLSGGSLVFAGTDIQAEQGIDDSPERLRADLLRVGGATCDPALVDLYVNHQMDAYAWLRNLGVRIRKVTLSGNQSRPRSHGVDPTALIRILAARAEALGVRTITRAKATAMSRAGATPRVEFTVDGTPHTVDTSHVVLASGGFARSRRALKTFAPRLVDARPMSASGAEGDGLYLAMGLGADLADMGSVKGTFGASALVDGVPEKVILLIALYRGAVIVNTEGRRFVDESLSYKTIGDVCLDQPGAMAYQIFDERVMRQTDPLKTVNDFAGALDRGYLLRADTLEELAGKISVDTTTLSSTIARYNDNLATGGDTEFGRTSLGGGYGEVTPVDKPPFYAFATTTGTPSTYGGLRTDESLRVVDVGGEPIPGLWAAGEVVGGFHGAGYMSGTSLGKCVIFGLVAGRAATQALPMK